MALVIPVDATPYLLTPEMHPSHFGPDGMKLEVMQKIVGGYIEHVYMRPPAYVRIEPSVFNLRLVVTVEPADGAVAYQNLVVNEEGKLLDLPVNLTATTIAREHGLPHDVIVGPAILLIDEEFQ